MKKINILVHSILALSVSLMGYSASASVGSISEEMMGPTEILTKLTVVASYIVGVGLIVFAIAQYKQHRRSPKLVPLTTPILMLILGVICVVIPYFSIISGKSFSASEQAKREGKMPDRSGAFSPDLPQVEKRPRPGPGRYAPTVPDDYTEEDFYEEEYDDGYDSGYSDEYDDSYDDEYN